MVRQAPLGAICQNDSVRGKPFIHAFGRNTKIHAVVDALGNPVKIYLTPGNVNDCTVATEVLDGVTLAGSIVMGDKA